MATPTTPTTVGHTGHGGAPVAASSGPDVSTTGSGAGVGRGLLDEVVGAGGGGGVVTVNVKVFEPASKSVVAAAVATTRQVPVVVAVMSAVVALTAQSLVDDGSTA